MLTDRSVFVHIVEHCRYNVGVVPIGESSIQSRARSASAGGIHWRGPLDLTTRTLEQLMGVKSMELKSASTSTAVERALTILETVAERERGLTNAELSRRLGVPKSSASYILRVLERRGYLRRDRETNKYRLGLRVLSLSRGALNGLDIRELALPS